MQGPLALLLRQSARGVRCLDGAIGYRNSLWLLLLRVNAMKNLAFTAIWLGRGVASTHRRPCHQALSRGYWFTEHGTCRSLRGAATLACCATLNGNCAPFADSRTLSWRCSAAMRRADCSTARCRSAASSCGAGWGCYRGRNAGTRCRYVCAVLASALAFAAPTCMALFIHGFELIFAF